MQLLIYKTEYMALFNIFCIEQKESESNCDFADRLDKELNDTIAEGFEVSILKWSEKNNLNCVFLNCNKVEDQLSHQKRVESSRQRWAEKNQPKIKVAQKPSIIR